MKTVTLTRSKINFDNEAEAQHDVCQSENLHPDQLEAAHTELNFVWLAEVEDTPFPIVKYKKIDLEENEAFQKAKAILDTFEGNIKRDHTDDYFRFTRVRG